MNTFIKPSIFCLCLIYAINASAFQLKDTVTAIEHTKKAEELRRNSKYPEAIKFYLQAKEIYKDLDLLDKEIQITNRLSGAYIRVGRFAEGLKQYDSLDNYRTKLGSTINVIDAYRTVGVFHSYTANYHVALEFYFTARDLSMDYYGESHPKIARILLNIGAVYNRLGKYNEATEFMLESIDILTKSNSGNTVAAGYAYNNLGNIYANKGDLNTAIEYFNKALIIVGSNFGMEHPDIAGYYLNIGNQKVLNGEVQSAIDYYQNAISILKKVYGDSHYDLAKAYQGLGEALRLNNKYEESLKYSSLALNLKLEYAPENYDEISQVYYNLGNVHKSMGNRKESKYNYDQCYNIRKANYAPDHWIMGECNDILMRFYMHFNDIDSALIFGEKSLDILNKNKSDNAIRIAEVNISLAKFYNDNNEYEAGLKYADQAININSIDTLGGKHIRPVIQLSAIYHKVNALFHLDDKKNSARILKLVKNADDLISEIRKANLSYLDKLEFNSSANKVYQLGLAVCYESYQVSQNRQFLEDAFYFSQQSKSSVLKNQLDQQSAFQISGIPDSILQLEHNLKIDKSFYYSKMINETDSSKIDEFQSKYLTSTRQYDSLIKSFASNYTKYYNLRYDEVQRGLNTLQKGIDSDETVLDFVVADDEIFVFKIRDDSESFFSLEKPDLLDSDIASIQDFLKDENVSAFKDVSYSLFQSLIEPLQLKSKRLRIIPNDVLWNLNFELLVSNNHTEDSFSSLPYLIKEYDITYSYGTEIFNSKTKTDVLDECLAFSYTNLNDTILGQNIAFSAFRDSEVDLPGSRLEVSEISKIFDGKYYFGSQANEGNFKRMAPNYKYLHLALHGEVAESPLKNQLKFVQSYDTLEDNSLHAFELFSMNLNADLAVLSACNSGAGELVSGEGLQSIASAFTYAGCKSVIVSQWELSDLIAPQIFAEFYKGIKSGESKSNALREAKLKYLESSDDISSNPYYWGGIVLYDASNDKPSNSNLYWLIAGGIMIVVIVVFRRFS